MQIGLTRSELKTKASIFPLCIHIFFIGFMFVFVLFIWSNTVNAHAWGGKNSKQNEIKKNKREIISQ